jgi:hypothetical protein
LLTRNNSGGGLNEMWLHNLETARITLTSIRFRGRGGDLIGFRKIAAGKLTLNIAGIWQDTTASHADLRYILGNNESEKVKIRPGHSLKCLYR